jgi:competence protein ComEC
MAVVAWLVRRESRVALFPLLAAWMLLGALISAVQPRPDPQTQLIALADGTKHSILGIVSRFAAVRTLESQQPFSNEAVQEQQLSVQLAVESVDGQTVSGGLRLAIFAPMNSLIAPVRCGDRMSLQTVLKEPEVYHDPGVWDGRAWLLGQGVGVLAAAKATDILLPTHGKRGSAACWIHALQVKAGERLIAMGTTKRPTWLPGWLTISEADAGMVTAIITGDRSYLERADRQGFERTGAFHVLVVSGLHVGLIAALVLAGMKRLGCSRGWSALLTGLLTSAYAVFTGFGAPVQRALAMVLLYLAARALFRGRDPLHALGVAALCLLAWNPAALFDAGLQMTILTVIATGGLVAPIAQRSFRPYLEATRQISLIALDAGLPPRLAQFRVTIRLVAEQLAPSRYRRRASEFLATVLHFFLRCLELLMMSAVVEVVIALPMALYFHRITVLALPVNLLLIPGLGILLPVAVLTAMVAIVAPLVALFPGAALAVLLHLATGIVHFFGGIEAADVRVATPSVISVVLVVLMGCASVWALRQRRVFGGVCVLASICAMVALLWPQPIHARPHVLEVSALDVGQGDSLLVVTPEGRAVMVDCGGPTGGSLAQHGNFEIGEDVVSPVLWSRGVHRLDAVVLSHAHSDHMGGMFAVLRNFRPRELWVGNNPLTQQYQALMTEAEHLHIAVRHFHAGDVLQYGGMDVRVLAPSADYVPGAEAKNDDSLVLRVAYGKTSALLEGDAEASSESQMTMLPSIHSDVLKVGHHGSKTSTTEGFLAAVSPRYAVVSVGSHNLYHHPRFETLEHLQEEGARTYRTDLDGMSTFYLDGKQVTSAP